MKSVVIAGYARSPFAFAHKGELTKVRPDDLLARIIAALVERTGLKTDDIEDVIVGCSFPEGEQGLNVARTIAFLAGLPQTAAATTVNRYCGSSMQSIHQAAGAIQMGAGEVFVCGGIESMTRVPIMGFNPMPNPALKASYPEAYCSMGVTAENVARKYAISRAEQEALAVASHAKAAEAQTSGRLADEIVGIETPAGLVDKDGCIRPGTSADSLSGLKPAFTADGTVTAGTSSPLTDGAAAVLVTTEEYARANGLPILAKIRSVAVAGCAPDLMGLGPVPATRKALARAGLSIADIDIIEINEAFSSQAIACMRDLDIDPSRINPDGGALALGHPLGATGARITGKAAALLKREGKQFALATQCIGGGQGIATILEAV
ncbi:acetyl-CoA acetyltransferase [Azospirillum thiophilum]|uniref:Acetyl-CoA acetyltransferase n=1 Tax=Azospirillum thiophilum TaxID=528244 RepID=A0AAC8VZV5_9PROT|nr:thiolase family protein [Azospirillum thiophilum]ALG72483.1 acetyl-CoA acetyltransferase [Azospirillum thiophilum]KJR61442.1 acetyl-CoA acetyltransferase [Azospirillum thiophilum]